MGLATHGFGGNTLGYSSVAFGTVINRLVPPNANGYTRVSTLKATAAGTAHTITAMRPIGDSTVTAVAAAGQAVLNVAAEMGPSGNTLAASDLLAIRSSADGITRLYTVSSVSTLEITLTGNLTTALAIGDSVWNFGVAANTDPVIGSAHPTFAIAASAQTTLTDTVGGVIASHEHDQPILLQDNNATATGSVDQVSYSYTID